MDTLNVTYDEMMGEPRVIIKFNDTLGAQNIRLEIEPDDAKRLLNGLFDIVYGGKVDSDPSPEDHPEIAKLPQLIEAIKLVDKFKLISSIPKNKP